MPTAIRVPDHFKQPLAKLLNLNESDGVALENAVADAPPILLALDLARRVAAKTPLESREAEQVTKLLVSLYCLREASEEPIQDFVNSVCVSAQDTGLKELSRDNPNWEQFKQRLARLLSFSNSLGVVAKAQDVMTEQQRVLCDVRVLTDARAVFGPDPKEAPTAIVLVHQLKLVYHEGPQKKEFYVAFDSDDLRKMRNLLERAAHKEQSLRAVMGLTKVPVLDSGTH